MSETDYLRQTVDGLIGQIRVTDEAVGNLKTDMETIKGEIKLINVNAATRDQFRDLSVTVNNTNNKVDNIDKTVSGVAEALKESLRERKDEGSFDGVVKRWQGLLSFALGLAAAYAMIRFGIKP